MDIVIKPGDAPLHDQRRRDTSYHVRKTMLAIASDDRLLHTVVADGPQVWRINFLREMQAGGLFVDEAVADSIYRFLCIKVRQRFHEEMRATTPWTAQGIATRYLDHTPPPAAPPTTREIIDSLEIDSASSDDGRRELYGRDGAPQVELEKMKDEARKALDVEGNLPADFKPPPPE